MKYFVIAYYALVLLIKKKLKKLRHVLSFHKDEEYESLTDVKNFRVLNIQKIPSSHGDYLAINRTYLQGLTPN